jgi:hypothetical protein
LGTSDDAVIFTRPPRYAQGLNAAFLDFEPPLANGLYRATLGPALRDQSGNLLVSNRVWILRIAHFDVATSHGFVMQGNIDFPGALDTFTFSAAAGQRLFFHLPPDSFRPIVYRSLLDPNYQVMREGNLGSVLGAITLTNAGIYSFFIGGITFFTDTGPYQLPVTEVPPPQEFNVAIGTTISPNQPGLGAGTIEAAGAKDVYWFNATAGQAITIDLVRYDFSLTLISMRVEEAGGTSLLDRWLGFGSATLTLEQGGAYRLVIGSDLEPGTGTYQIRLQPQ